MSVPRRSNGIDQRLFRQSAAHTVLLSDRVQSRCVEGDGLEVDAVALRRHPSELARQHSAPPEVPQRDHDQQQRRAHENQRHDGEALRVALQVVSEVHAEDACAERAQRQTARQHRQHSLCDQQLIARCVQSKQHLKHSTVIIMRIIITIIMTIIIHT